MRYYIMELNPRCDATPVINGWAQKYDTRHINTRDSHKLPQRELLLVDPDEEMFFPDVISRPFFMVTKKVFDVVKMYQPGIVSKQVVLLDGKYGQSESYFMPILKDIDCLHSDSARKRDGWTLAHIVLDESRIGNEALFRIANASHTIAVARLDFAESVLRRQAKGVGLVPIEVR